MHGRRRLRWLVSLNPEYIPGSFFINTRYKSSVLTIQVRRNAKKKEGGS